MSYSGIQLECGLDSQIITDNLSASDTDPNETEYISLEDFRKWEASDLEKRKRTLKRLQEESKINSHLESPNTLDSPDDPVVVINDQ